MFKKSKTRPFIERAVKNMIKLAIANGIVFVLVIGIVFIVILLLCPILIEACLSWMGLKVMVPITVLTGVFIMIFGALMGLAMTQPDPPNILLRILVITPLMILLILMFSPLIIPIVPEGFITLVVILFCCVVLSIAAAAAIQLSLRDLY